MKYLRTYPSYEEYIEHQKIKSSTRTVRRRLKKSFDEKIDLFVKRFKNIVYIPTGSRILCLGARFGSEVEAWKKLGMDGIGIDLVPMPEHNVVYGDFHSIPFPDSSFDATYSNSCDHSNDIHQFLSESRRVLKIGGIMVLDLMLSGKATIGEFEVIQWERDDDMVNLAEGHGFFFVGNSNLTSRVRLYRSCHDCQLIFKRVN